MNIMKQIKLPKVHLACSIDGINTKLKHIFITKTEVVATDGHILVIHKIENLFSDSVIRALPEKCYINGIEWNKLSKPFEILQVINNQIRIVRKKGSDYIDLLDGDKFKYPNYQRIIPKKKIVLC